MFYENHSSLFELFHSIAALFPYLFIQFQLYLWLSVSSRSHPKTHPHIQAHRHKVTHHWYRLGWLRGVAPGSSSLTWPHPLPLTPLSLCPDQAVQWTKNDWRVCICVVMCENVTEWQAMSFGVFWIFVQLKCVHPDLDLMKWQFSSWDLAPKGTGSQSAHHLPAHSFPFHCCPVFASTPPHLFPTWSLILSLRSNTPTHSDTSA